MTSRSIILVTLSFGMGIAADQLLVKTPTIQAQEQFSASSTSFIIGDTLLWLGMSPDMAMPQLRKKYTLVGDLPGASGLITIKQHDEEVGTLLFISGKLVDATTKWTSVSGNDSIDRLWAALDGALSSQVPVTLKASTPAEIHRYELLEPDAENRGIDIRFGERTIHFWFQKSRSKPSRIYSVAELLTRNPANNK
jgi:hypothetical protein